MVYLKNSIAYFLLLFCVTRAPGQAQATPDSLEILRSGSQLSGVREARLEVSVGSSLAQTCGVTFSETFRSAEAFLSEVGLSTTGDLDAPMLTVRVLGISIDSQKCALSIEASLDRQAWLGAIRTPNNLVRAPIWTTQSLVVSTRAAAKSTISGWLQAEATQLRPTFARR
jgi:hypothetical protein